jgi:hypothetical protein
VTVGQLEFFYDFPRPGDPDYPLTLIKFDNDIVEDAAQSLWKDFDIAPETPLMQLAIIFDPQFQTITLRKASEIQQNLELFDRLLSGPTVDSSTIATQTIAAIDREYSLEYIAMLLDRGIIKAPISVQQAANVLNTRMLLDVGVRLAPNEYVGIKGLQEINGQLVKTATFPMLALIVQGRYSDFHSVIRSALSHSGELRRQVLDFYEAVMQRCRPYLPKYHKIRTRIVIENDGDYPIAIQQRGEIQIAGPADDDAVAVPALLYASKTDSATKRGSVSDTVLIANVIAPKQQANFTMESTAALDSLDARVATWQAAGILKVRVSATQSNAPAMRSARVNSDWAPIEAKGGLARPLHAR